TALPSLFPPFVSASKEKSILSLVYLRPLRQVACSIVLTTELRAGGDQEPRRLPHRGAEIFTGQEHRLDCRALGIAQVDAGVLAAGFIGFGGASDRPSTAR